MEFREYLYTTIEDKVGPHESWIEVYYKRIRKQYPELVSQIEETFAEQVRRDYGEEEGNVNYDDPDDEYTKIVSFSLYYGFHNLYGAMLSDSYLKNVLKRYECRLQDYEQELQDRDNYPEEYLVMKRLERKNAVDLYYGTLRLKVTQLLLYRFGGDCYNRNADVLMKLANILRKMEDYNDSLAHRIDDLIRYSTPVNMELSLENIDITKCNWLSCCLMDYLYYFSESNCIDLYMAHGCIQLGKTKKERLAIIDAIEMQFMEAGLVCMKQMDEAETFFRRERYIADRFSIERSVVNTLPEQRFITPSSMSGTNIVISLNNGNASGDMTVNNKTADQVNIDGINTKYK